MTIQVISVQGNKIEALTDFDYQNIKGTYMMEGLYDNGRRTLDFEPTRWIRRPEGAQVVGMNGSISSDGMIYKGKMAHDSCESFKLAFVNSNEIQAIQQPGKTTGNRTTTTSHATGTGLERYYPLQAGATWEYQIQRKGMFGDSGNISIFMKAMKPRQLAGKQVTPIQINDSDIDFMVVDGTGVYELGEQKMNDIEPTVHRQPAYSIKYPLQVGTTWQDMTDTVLLEQRVEDIPVTARIEAVDDIVTVPAGTFEGCIRVKYTAKVTADMDKREGTGMKIFGKANIEIEDYQWYAPNVGFIKQVRKESSNHLMFGSGQAAILLTNFTQ